jgi:hypothetical protein
MRSTCSGSATQPAATFSNALFMDGSFACVARSLASAALYRYLPARSDIQGEHRTDEAVSAPNSVPAAPSWATGWLEARPLANDLGRVRVNADRQRRTAEDAKRERETFYTTAFSTRSLLGFEFGSGTAVW